MQRIQFNLRKADASYVAFPAIDKWLNLSIDLPKWERYLAKIRAAASHPPETLEHAQRIVRRYAAIETGAIETLYSVERGFTRTVAFELAGMEALLSEKGANTVNLIESQLNGYDYILDLATTKTPFSEAWIRELHQIICQAQETYSVLTSQGPQERSLPLGKYKIQPNHVVKADGGVYSYCPVDMVGAEMFRMVEIIRSQPFQALHPVIQAAFAHYAFVRIHPFSDGNGRVARALASVFLYRSASIPLLIMAEERESYIDVLESADQGNYQAFVDFILERSYAAIDLVELSLKAGLQTPAQDSLDKLQALFLTKGGFIHKDVDRAAKRFIEAFDAQLKLAYRKMVGNPFLKLSEIDRNNAHYNPISTHHRLFLNKQGLQTTISISSKAPAQATVESVTQIHIPKDCGELDDFILHSVEINKTISARISELLPVTKASLEIKLVIFAESIVDELADRLLREAKKAYQG